MKRSEQVIADLKQEVLKLKIMLHARNSKDGEVGGFDYESNRQDVINQLTLECERYKKLAQARENERKTGQVKDVACVTHLNSMNIDELIKASIILKRQEEEQNVLYPRNSTPQPAHRQREQQSQQQRPQVQKLCYPNVTPPENTIANPPPPKNGSLSRNLKPDEKSILETLCYVNGIMTTARDKLRAKSDHG